MQRRTWVAVVAVFIIVLTSLSFVALKVGSRHPAVRRAVLSRVLPEIDADLTIGDLEMGLASLAFSDVIVDMGERGWIAIPEVTVGLSYRRLLANGLEIRRSLSTVIVSDPVITFRYGLSEEEDRGASGLLGLGPYLPEYLAVSEATLMLEDSRTGRSIELSELDLLVGPFDGDLAEGSATASLLGGEANLAVDIEWDTSAETIHADAELTDSALAPGLPLPQVLPFDVREGSVYATGSVTLREGAADLLLSFVLERADLVVDGELGQIQDLSGAGSFDGEVVSLTVSEAAWRGGRISALGELDLRSGELRSLDLEVRNLDLAEVAALAGAPLPAVSGPVDIDASISGPWRAPSIDALVKGEEISVGEELARDLSARVRYADAGIDLIEVAFLSLGGRADLYGTIRSDGDSTWTFLGGGSASGLDASLVATLLDLPESEGSLSASDVGIEASSGSLEIESLVRWSELTVGPVFVGSGAGGFLLKDDVLSATLSDSAGAVALTGQLESIFENPSIDAELSVSGMRLDTLFRRADLPIPPAEVQGNITASGPIEGFSVGGSIVATGARGRASVSVDGIVGLSTEGSTVSLDVRSPDAVVSGVELPFSAALYIDAERVALDPLAFEGLGEVRAEASSVGDRALRGSVVVSEAQVDDVVALLTGDTLPESVGGLVFASVSLGGTLGSPDAEGQIQVGNGRAMGVDGLGAVLAGTLEDGVIEIEEMGLNHRGERVATVEGVADLDGDLRLVARGRGLPGPLLGGDDETRFDVSLGIGGTSSSPTLDGLVEGRDGAFLDVSFDEFLCRVTGAEGVLRVDPLHLEKRGSYRARAEGSIPLSALSEDAAGSEAVVTVEVDGDPLALLADAAPFARGARGEGALRAVLAGTRDQLTVASATLSASEGTIIPSGIFERVEDVDVELSIADGVLRNGLVTGTVRGDPIVLESATFLPEGSEPLFFAGIEVGALELRTGEEGVRASIPGLMLPQDVGRVVVQGKDGAGSLLITGPPERPRLSGEVVFSDMSFTYPLLESEAGVGGFLSGSDWSLRMTAGRNLWYTRADANLQIVRGSSLDFRGVPDDGTLCVFGRVESQRGTVTYANSDFEVREASVDFPYFCEPPRFYVVAETRVEDGTTITLTMDSYESAFAGSAPGATFDESELRLASDSPEDDSREEILSKLQYGVSYELLETEEQASLERRRALEVIGSQLSGRIVRPLLSPVEGRIKRTLNLDLVRFEIDFVEHFLAELDLWQAQEGGGGYQPFLTDTRITLGKYISSDWLLSYVGHADAYEEDLGDERIGFRQELGVEYEVSRNTSLSMRVVYDPALAGWDRRLTIENRFRF